MLVLNIRLWFFCFSFMVAVGVFFFSLYKDRLQLSASGESVEGAAHLDVRVGIVQGFDGRAGDVLWHLGGRSAGCDGSGGWVAAVILRRIPLWAQNVWCCYIWPSFPTFE